MTVERLGGFQVAQVQIRVLAIAIKMKYRTVWRSVLSDYPARDTA